MTKPKTLEQRIEEVVNELLSRAAADHHVFWVDKSDEDIKNCRDVFYAGSWWKNNQTIPAGAVIFHPQTTTDGRVYFSWYLPYPGQSLTL